MRISGFTFVRNSSLLDYPVEESIRSLLPLVNELIVNVPESEDDTLKRMRSIKDSRLNVFKSDWDESMREGGRILALQTNRALQRCTGEWAFYLQADEVLHEADYPALRAALRLYSDRPSVDGLNFRFVHFEGGYRLVNPFRYRRQVRVIRNNGSIVSWGDACGFRKKDGRPLRTRNINARVFHYGWARDARSLLRKNVELEKLYHGDEYLQQKYGGKEVLESRNLSVCVPFRGTHPAVMRTRIETAGWQADIPKWRLPLALQPRAWRLLLKKWGVWR